MILCPRCGSPTTVTETRHVRAGSRRRRRCENLACNEKVTTVEFIVATRDKRPIADVAVIRERDLQKLAALVDIMLGRERLNVNDDTTGDQGT